MTDKELKRLSRAELLEMLLAQNEENERLKTELAQAQKALDDRRILIDECGTMAEAALKLNGVFDAVDKYDKCIKCLSGLYRSYRFMLTRKESTESTYKP